MHHGVGSPTVLTLVQDTSFVFEIAYLCKTDVLANPLCLPILHQYTIGHIFFSDVVRFGDNLIG